MKCKFGWEGEGHFSQMKLFKKKKWKMKKTFWTKRKERERVKVKDMGVVWTIPLSVLTPNWNFMDNIRFFAANFEVFTLHYLLFLYQKSFFSSPYICFYNFNYSFLFLFFKFFLSVSNSNLYTFNINFLLNTLFLFFIEVKNVNLISLFGFQL